ncbi:MAG TPA: zinc ribbon domain-containing protein [Pyrinomonadaceae bacterium]|nr:zinc ribbon domain-containing protein [Pyrinomonadaceae bacterium]
MFCIACGTPLAAGLSYCNRCGTSLKERSESKTIPITAFITAITLIAMMGLGIMLGGALTLKREAGLNEALVGFFMLFTFLIVTTTEVLLVRQLSKLTNTHERKTLDVPAQFMGQPQMPAAQPRSLAEPVHSVTENTTRTLQYLHNEPGR